MTTLKHFLSIIMLMSLEFANAQTVWGVDNSRTETRDNAGLQGNQGALSGFFQSAAPVNYPTGASGWWHLLDVRHSNATNNYAMQFAGSFFDQQLWFRKTNSSPTQSWNRIITEANSQAVIGTATGVGGNLKLLDESNVYINMVFGSMASANNRSGLFLQSNGAITQVLNGNPAAGFAFRWLSAPSGTVNYYDDSNEKMRLTMNGYLGIGTTGPTAPLTVSTTASNMAIFQANTATNSFVTVKNNTGQLNLGIGNTNPHPYIWSSTDKLFIGSDGASPTLFVKGMSSGSVGIGTTSVNDVNYKLFVETGIRTKKVRVDVGPWADYVFDNNYRLRTLDELENFVNENKHLPEIPSADEVQKNGIDLGGNQALLLKKIEELTLYVIDQNKKIEDLKRENANIKEDIKLLKLK